MRIPRTEANVRLSMANQPTMSPDALTGPGRALQGLGKALAGLGEDMAQPSDGELLDSQLAQMDAATESQKYYTERQAALTPDTDPDAWHQETTSGINQIWDSKTDRVSANPKVQQGYQVNRHRFVGSYDVKAHETATGIKTERRATGAVETFKGALEGVDPSTPEGSLILDTIDKQLGRVPGLDAEKARGILADKILEGIDAEAGKDPITTLEKLEDVKKSWGDELRAPPAAEELPKVDPQSNAAPSNVNISAVKSDGMAIVTSGSGARVRVSGNYADRFAGLISDLEARGLKIDAKQTGGYANRNIAGTNTKSRHAAGEAIDINWSENARGAAGKIRDVVPVNEINQLASKWGLKWGGNWKNPDDMHFEVDRSSTPGQAFAAAPQQTSPEANDQPGIAADVTAYSPQKGGSKMEGGYAAAKPGPDGKAEVRTLADFAAGNSKYVTVAGNPRDYGKKFTIPEISFVDAKGQRKTLKNVQAVVHDTGSAFKNAPEGRFDIPIDLDATNKQMAASHAMWKKQGVRFVPEEAPAPETPVAQRGLTQYAGLGGPKNTMTDASPEPVTGTQGTPAQSGVRAENTIPSVKVADASGLTPQQFVQQQKDAQANAVPGDVRQPQPQWRTPSIRTRILDAVEKKMPAWVEARSRVLNGYVDRAEKSAAEGYVLPDDERALIEGRLAKYGTPEQQAKYAASLSAATQTSQMKAMTPVQLEQVSNQLRGDMQANGANPDTIARAKAVEGLHARMAKELNENPLGWGVESGVIPSFEDITPETFGTETLAKRAQEVQAVSDHFGPQYWKAFTPNERAWMEDTVKKGGDQMISMMGSIYDAFGDNTPEVVAEIAPKNPEAVRAGELLTIGGDPAAARDIAKTMQRRADPNYKGDTVIGDSVTTTEASLREVAGDYYTGRDKREKDATMRAAEAIYMARVDDPKKYDAELFKQSVEAAIGVRTGAGADDKFGGFVTMKPGWPGRGGSNQIILPSNVRQKTFRTMLDSVTPDDLVAANHAPPLYGDGTPVRLGLVKGGAFEQVGDGKYRIKIKTGDDEPERYVVMRAPVPPGMAVENAPFVPFEFDFKKLTPILRKRNSMWFGE